MQYIIYNQIIPDKLRSATLREIKGEFIFLAHHNAFQVFTLALYSRTQLQCIPLLLDIMKSSRDYNPASIGVKGKERYDQFWGQTNFDS